MAKKVTINKSSKLENLLVIVLIITTIVSLGLVVNQKSTANSKNISNEPIKIEQP